MRNFNQSTMLNLTDGVWGFYEAYYPGVPKWVRGVMVMRVRPGADPRVEAESRGATGCRVRPASAKAITLWLATHPYTTVIGPFGAALQRAADKERFTMKEAMHEVKRLQFLCKSFKDVAAKWEAEARMQNPWIVTDDVGGFKTIQGELGGVVCIPAGSHFSGYRYCDKCDKVQGTHDSEGTAPTCAVCGNFPVNKNWPQEIKHDTRRGHDRTPHKPHSR